jgi:hypothetical protein
MGGVSWRGGSQEVIKLTTTTQLKMEDTCILCNVIKTFWHKKMTKVEKWEPFVPFKFQMALAQSCKNTLACLCKQPNTSIAKGRNWSMGCQWWYFISLAWIALEATNPWIAQDQGNKSTHVGSMMTTSTKVQMPSLVNIMLTRQWKELNVLKGSACNCSRPTWKPAFHIMSTKVLQITSWVLMHSLPWAQHKRWIPIRLMGCVHTHQGMLAIERWGNQSCVQNVMQKIGEDNWKFGRLVEM